MALLCFSQALYVDSKEAFAFSLFLPTQDSVTFHLYDPSSQEVGLEDHLELGTFPLGDTGNAVPTATYVAIICPPPNFSVLAISFRLRSRPV